MGKKTSLGTENNCLENDAINLINAVLSNSHDCLFKCSDGRFLPHSFLLRKKLIKFRRLKSSTRIHQCYDDSWKLERKIKFVKKSLKKLKEIGIKKKNPIQVEIGSGHGLLSLLWAIFSKNSILSTDLSPWQLRIGDEKIRYEELMKYAKTWLLTIDDNPEKHLKKINTVAMNALQMGLPDNSVDLFISENTFEHILDVEKLISEISRCLKPNAILVAKWSNFYDIFGCHTLGITGIPWGHALLSENDLKKYCMELYSVREGNFIYNTLSSLNRKKISEWINILEAHGITILDLEETSDSIIDGVNISMLCNLLPPGLDLHDTLISDIKIIAKKAY